MAILDANDIMFRAFEPKVQNRFVLNIDTIPAFMVKNVKAPTFTDNVVKLDHINSYRKIRGKREWDDITMVLYDPITPSGAQAVMEWVRLSHESVTGRDGYSDFYKKDVTFNMLGPVGDIVEEWKLKGKLGYCLSTVLAIRKRLGGMSRLGTCTRLTHTF